VGGHVRARRPAPPRAPHEPSPTPATCRRAALYVRVSTDEQETDNQRHELERVARARGFEVVDVYEEIESAVKKRPAYEKMKSDAHRRRFDVLMIWAIDRFGRSLAGNVADIVELDRVGIQIISVSEPWLDTSGPVRGLLIAIFSWCAEQERLRLIERTKAGLARARREGKRLGRKPRRFDVARARALRAEGKSLREVGAALGVSKSTLARELARVGHAASASANGRGEDPGAKQDGPDIERPNDSGSDSHLRSRIEI